MDDLIFTRYAREEMARDSISEDEVYHVIGDADEEYERDDGRIEYGRILGDGRQICVVVGDVTRTIWTVFWNKRGSRSGRR
ncbi:MAG: DUF4258 domain-containing protein [Chloroflexi bacterium]|nr:DUF4258 domain-containing protein [Chloroflexota bacterium]